MKRPAFAQDRVHMIVLQGQEVPTVILRHGYQSVGRQLDACGW